MIGIHRSSISSCGASAMQRLEEFSARGDGERRNEEATVS